MTPRRPHTHPRGGPRRYRLTGPKRATGVAVDEAHARDVRREKERDDDDAE